MSLKRNFILATLLVGIFLVSVFKVEAVPFDGEFWFNNVKYKTLSTPTDLTNTGAPDSTFNRIYIVTAAMGGCDPDPTHLQVINSAPGETNFRGGRWKIYILSFGKDCANFQDAVSRYAQNRVEFRYSRDLEKAISDGVASLGSPVRIFECPVINDK
ncbi:hypothetical protein G9A89_017275 [Geosiphon pyriformis]|nr:hypothetical protein G9A89_017275 [Geosiphon pyriformis]